jgi:uncharacterized protein (DUF362 family)
LGGVLTLALGACREEHAPASKPAPKPSATLALAPSASAAAPEASAADTISQASEVYDAGPPLAPVALGADSEIDGAALRRRHIERLKSDRSPVTVLRGQSALELGQKLCEAVVPQRPKDVPVVIKPNICGFDGFKDPAKSGGDDGVKGRVTEPEFVRGVVRCLKERGHTRITVAEGCGVSHAHWKKAIQLSGFAAMAEAERVPLVALDDDGVYDVQGDQPGKPLRMTGIAGTRVPTLLMPKLLGEALEHGLFISVPKVKAHRYSVVSLGIKGMQGTVMRSDGSPAYNQKWRMHAELNQYLRQRRAKEPEDRALYVSQLELFSERLLDVLELSLPDAVLAEATPAVSGDGFQKLRNVPGMVAIGGTNPVLVDRVGAEYLGLWNNAALGRELRGHKTSPLITLAARRYGIDLKAPELAGDGQAVLAEKRPVYFKAIAPFTLDGDQVITPPPAAARPTAHAARTATPPTIDGAIDAAWSRAQPIRFDSDYSGASTGIFTSARFLWSEAALFALFELGSTDLNVNRSLPTTSERPKLYEEDCVELFLTPDPSAPHAYYEVELGPAGHWFDLAVDRQKKTSDTNWSSQVKVATKSDAAAHTAIIEARFTAPELLAALKSGARLPLGVFRMEGKTPRKYLAWSPARTAKPNFHVPEAFGTLVIDG